MLPLLSMLSLAQATPVVLKAEAAPPALVAEEILQPQAVRALPGQLDEIPVFNSNSPEIVQSEGILLSTFPSAGMAFPAAHLDFAFDGRFDVFAHHIARGRSPNDDRTLYMGVLAHNPGDQPVTVNLRESASYLTQEAPFYNLATATANPLGNNFSGPGSRVMNDILRDRRHPAWPEQLEIPAGQSRLLMNVPIPLRSLSVPTDGTLAPGSAILPPPKWTEVSSRNKSLPANARSTLARLASTGPIYVASLAMLAPLTPEGGERVPNLAEWRELLVRSDVVSPRDHPPTPPDDADEVERFFYGRVAGVAQGSRWTAKITDSPRAEKLSIPEPGEEISYVLSTVDGNTFGTGQIQSAPMLARYADTAYKAHGNYGIEYALTLPLHNPTHRTQTVSLLMQTPLQDETLAAALRFQDPPDTRVFFRGTLLFLYSDDFGISRARFLHLTQNRGQQGEPLVTLRLPPGGSRSVKVQFLYPPDATPPQVLTIQTVDDETP
ncbi:MAG: DUF3370 domain-containing protein [Cyanothece sp. SIO1E1]|nr:DUF3370 domain-containing protein [Cyanothece sp. SIO1E1]